MREEYEGFDEMPDVIRREEIGCEEIDLGFMAKTKEWS